MWSGRTAPSGASLGNASVIWKTAPRRDPSSNSGLYVAGTQIDSNLHLRLNDLVSLWLPISYGFSQGAFSAVPCQIERPPYGVWSAGFGAGFSGQVSEHWYLAGSFEFMLGLVPTHILATCVGGSCVPGLTTEDQDTDAVPILRGSLLAGVDWGWIRLFGGLAARNHPTNVSLDYEIALTPEAIGGDVRMGPVYMLFSLGAEVDLGRFVSILAQVSQPVALGQPDLIYGPIGGVSVDLHAAK
jgi:hypothetical protein